MFRDARKRRPDGARAVRNDALRDLPAVARVYVASVILIGGALLIRAAPPLAGQDVPLLLTLLSLTLSASIAKITLPLPNGTSTISVCNVMDYSAMLLLGTQPASITAAVGALAQCTFRNQIRNPPHRTAFSVAALAISVNASGAMLSLAGTGSGVVGPWKSFGIEGLLAGGVVYFVLNTGLVAVAVALTSRQPILTVWVDNFFWTWPGYLLGAGIACGVVKALDRSPSLLLPLAVIPLGFLYHHLRQAVQQRRDALTDPLTGLPNLRMLHRHVECELKRWSRRTAQLSVVVFDLNGFKRINDRYGHAAGDRTLYDVAVCLRAVVGERGLCVRTGGDEFVVALTQCDPLTAGLLAAEVQATVGSLRLRTETGVLLQPSLSAGTASAPEDGRTLDELLRAADDRMFEAKRAGQTPRGVPAVPMGVALQAGAGRPLPPPHEAAADRRAAFANATTGRRRLGVQGRFGAGS
jgi:diguanylate cyclase (GGDEF)-like protein